jgi:hypothetical protein
MLASSFVVHDPNRSFLPRQASGAEESRDDRAWGAIMDVGGWLRRLGLGQYEAVFRDETIFPKLTAEDAELTRRRLQHAPINWHL